MKKEFYLTPYKSAVRGIKVKIDNVPDDIKPILTVGFDSNMLGYLSGRDLERFAVNILKAMDSRFLIEKAKWKKIK